MKIDKKEKKKKFGVQSQEKYLFSGAPVGSLNRLEFGAVEKVRYGQRVRLFIYATSVQ